MDKLPVAAASPCCPTLAMSSKRTTGPSTALFHHERERERKRESRRKKIRKKERMKKRERKREKRKREKKKRERQREKEKEKKKKRERKKAGPQYKGEEGQVQCTQEANARARAHRDRVLGFAFVGLGFVSNVINWYLVV